MTTFLRLLHDTDKSAAMATTSGAVRQGHEDSRVFSVEPEAFQDVPGAPFAYWVSDNVRNAFQRLPPFETEGRTAKVGLQTGDDFRFVRAWWEVNSESQASPGKWFPFAKGGAYSPFYADAYLAVNWANGGAEICSFVDPASGKTYSRPQNTEYYFRPGLTWPRRTNGFSVRVLPKGCVFADKGPCAFAVDDSPADLLTLAAILNSRVFLLLLSLQLARTELAQSFEVGLIEQTPIPPIEVSDQQSLCSRALRGWSLKRTLDTINETSHTFLLPALLRSRLDRYDPPAVEEELTSIQTEIDDTVFDLYGFDDADGAAMRQLIGASGEEGDATTAGVAVPAISDQDDEDDTAVSADGRAELLSWCVGVAFGRFDWRLATGEREAPPEPDPFDSLPAKSPCMLPDGAEPFHGHAGILVDDKGNPHDLPNLIEEVLMKIDMPVPSDVREWLQHDFFTFHLQHYSKSRRRAPIYWPLSTRSGGYTLWVCYPSLTDQTLYTAVNDFVEPKLKQVAAQLATLGAVGGKRTHDEEQTLEELEGMEDELTDLGDTLLKIAPTYHPNQDDGVQISAAPLWLLFHNKPWEKLLKETWTKLEKGNYDWSHLAMDYWPDRVRAKCVTDKSLATAHGLDKTA